MDVIIIWLVLHFKLNTMTKYYVIVILFLSTFSYGNLRDRVDIDAGDVISSSKLCYFENKKYSFGSIIEINNIKFQCDKRNSFETNGELSWIKLN
ncbi:DUF1496 domain-containing protein [Paraphotobacterium marinum]